MNRCGRSTSGKRCSLALASALLLAACTASSAKQSNAVFVETPETASMSQIEFSSGPLSVSRASVLALCRSVEVTLQRGFRFMLIYDRTPLSAGQATWKLMLFHRPPPGLPVLDLDRPEWEGDPPANGVIDAGSLVTACMDESNARQSATRSQSAEEVR